MTTPAATSEVSLGSDETRPVPNAARPVPDVPDPAQPSPDALDASPEVTATWLGV